MNPFTRVAKAITAAFKRAIPPGLSAVDSRGWVTLFQGSQRHLNFQTHDVEVNQDKVVAQATVFACITLIASDIGKLCLRLVEKDDGIWKQVDSPAFSPVLRKPNRYQTTQKFIEQWIVSKLTHGNAYILKQRDNRGVVVAMYVLDPSLVTPLVAPDGSVYYQLQEDDLSRVPIAIQAIPASEIIHDRMVCLFHPLVGVSPIFACGLAATQALKIQQNSAKFFENMSRPSGILTAPGQISDDTAKRMKEHWDTNFSGDNIGKVAVLGDSLKYEAMSTNPVDAQLVEQLQMSAKQVAATFHVPAYMVGAEELKASTNIEAEQIRYFGQCLQTLIKSVEDSLDEGLGLPDVTGRVLGTEFDLDDLLRMDTTALTAALRDQVGAGIAKPNEARKRLNLEPVEGGDTPYLQQQNYALSALAKRDSGEDPFGTAKPPAPPAPEPAEPDPEMEEAAEKARAVIETAHLMETLRKGLLNV